MKKSEALKLLSHDISGIELPPISDKVRQAVRRRNESNETYKFYSQPEHIHKALQLKYIFAAMLLILAVSVPTIVAFTNRSSVPVITDKVINYSSSLVSMSDASEPISAPVYNESVLDRIKLKKLYGDVALSDKSKIELETLLTSYAKTNDVYEDDEYIYNFNLQGKLIELYRKSPDYENDGSSVTVNEQDILKKTTELLEELFPGWTDEELCIEGGKDCLPAWTVSITKERDDISDEEIFCMFDSRGNLLRVCVSGSAESIGNISREEAIKLVLDEIKSGKYDVSGYDEGSVRVITDVNDNHGYPCYIIFVKVMQEDKIIAYSAFLVDPDTGSIENI